MKSVPPFLFVGGTAAAVHQMTVIGIVESGLLTPAWANLPAFMVAWIVSYLGHRTFTFRSTRPHREAAPRFLAISILAFLVNQAFFVVLLRFSSLHYAVALFMVLVTVAVLTYVLSRYWAFSSVGSLQG